MDLNNVVREGEHLQDNLCVSFFEALVGRLHGCFFGVRNTC